MLQHPLFSKPKLLLAYVLVWIIFILLNIAVDRQVHDANLGFALIESLTMAFILAFLGVGIWYVVFFGGQDQKIISSFLYHIFAVVLVISFWIWLSKEIIESVIKNPEYIASFNETTSFKVMIGFFIYLLLAAFYYLFIYYARLEEKTLEESKLQTLVTQVKLDALKSQINPHFLFNSLNSVSYLTVSEPEKAQEMVIKLSNFLRYSLKHSDNEMVQINDELAHIQLYLEIEKVRFGDKLMAEFDLETCSHCKIPNMILQPLYENAIKYGVYETTESVLIHTTVQMDGEMLSIRIVNNFDPDSPSKKGEGVGLRNIKNRLGLMFGDVSLLKTNVSGETYIVELMIPQK